MIFFNKKNFNKKIDLNNDILDLKNKIDYSNIKFDGFVVQGLLILDNYVIMSSYCKKNSVNDKKMSRLYFYDVFNGKLIGHVVLDNSCHVGGIAYDKNNDILYVTGSLGRINAYDFNSVLGKLKNNSDLVKYDSNLLDLRKYYEGNLSAATICFYDNKLYVATCSSEGKMIEFTLNLVDNKIFVSKYNRFKNIPPCVQGICVFEYLGKKYFLISQSYSKIKSTIKLYNSDFEFLGQLSFNTCGIEGIIVSNSGYIYCTFENSVSCILKKHISNLNGKINNSLENKYFSYGQLHQNKLDSRDKII